MNIFGMQQRSFITLVITFFLSFTIEASETPAQAWETSLKDNPSLKALQARIDKSKFKLKQIYAMALPSLKVTTGYTALSDEPAAIFSLGPGQEAAVPMKEDEFSFTSVTLTVPLFSSGQLANADKAQNHIINSEKASYSAAVLDLKKQISENYVQILKLKEKQLAAVAYVASLRNHHKNINSLLDAGMALKADLLASNATLAKAKLQQNQLNSALKQVRKNYNRLLGREFDFEFTLTPISQIPISDTFENLVEKAIENNSQLQSLNFKQKALGYTKKVYSAKDLPQVAFVAGYKYEDNQYQRDKDMLSASLVLNWDFDFGVNRHQANQYGAKSQELSYIQTDVIQQIRLGLTVALENHRLAREATKSMLLALRQAQEYKRTIEDRYHSGLAIQAEVLAAHALLLSSESDFFDAKYDALLSTIEILHITNSLDRITASLVY